MTNEKWRVKNCWLVVCDVRYAIGHQQRQRHPGQTLQVVDVFDLRGNVSAEGKDGGGEGGVERFEFKSAAGESIGAPGGDDEVNDDADLDGDGRGEDYQ